MSKIVGASDQTEVSTNKPESVALENPISTEQKGNLNTNDTNSSTQNEISPLKRDSSEISGIDEKTPARTKKTRTDRFKEESEALLKSFGLEDGPGSEKRLTRSRTGRSTPASTPVSKPETVKQTTGLKRGRKPSEKKEQLVTEDNTVKATPKKGRGRPKVNAVVDNGENSSTTEESTKMEAESNISGDQNDKSSETKDESEKKSEVNSAEESKLIVPEVVVTKEETSDSSNDKTSDKKSDKNNDKTKTVTESSKNERKSDSLTVQKEDVKEKPTNLSEIKSVENSKKTAASINSTDDKMTTNDTSLSKVENNLTNNNQPVKEQTKKNELVDQLAKPVEQSTEKVVENNKLTSESVEKQEVKTA